MQHAFMRFTLVCLATIGLAGCTVAGFCPGIGVESESFNYLSVWESQLPDPAPAERTLAPHGAAH